VFADVVERHTRSGDCSNQQYIASARIKFTGEQDFALSAVTVTSYLHKAAVELDVQRTNQIGQEHESIVKYSNDSEFAVRGGGPNIFSKLAYSFAYLLF